MYSVCHLGDGYYVIGGSIKIPCSSVEHGHSIIDQLNGEGMQTTKDSQDNFYGEDVA